MSRLVIDRERFTDGTEQMEQVGMGAADRGQLGYTRDARPVRPGSALEPARFLAATL